MCVTINLNISFAVLEFPTSLSINNVLLLAAMVRSLGHVCGLPCMLTTQHTGLILGWDGHPKCLPISPCMYLGMTVPPPTSIPVSQDFKFSPHPYWVNYLYCSSLVQVPEIPRSACAQQSWNSRLLTNPPPPPLTDSVKLRDCVNQRWRFNLCTSS